MKTKQVPSTPSERFAETEDMTFKSEAIFENQQKLVSFKVSRAAQTLRLNLGCDLWPKSKINR